MKKITFAIFLTLLLSGCGIQSKNTTVSVTPEPIQEKVYFKNDFGYVQGNQIVVFLQNKDKSKKMKFSFEGDVSKLHLADEVDLRGKKIDLDYSSFNYANFFITLDPTDKGGFMQDTFKGFVYRCDGALYTSKGFDRPNFFCKTNNKDYLEQFEILMFGPSAGDASIGFIWSKIYIKRFSGADIFFFAYLASEENLNSQTSADMSFNGDFKNYKSQYYPNIFGKEYLEKLIHGERGALGIERNDDFVRKLHVEIVQ